jgi:hypothetical protein
MRGKTIGTEPAAPALISKVEVNPTAVFWPRVSEELYRFFSKTTGIFTPVMIGLAERMMRLPCLAPPLGG